MELHLVEHVRRLRGGSQPRLMRASDGNLYVVKLQDNPQGSRVLANELLASRLAQHLGLPVPQAEILELPAKLAESLYFETPTGPKRICPGPQLGLRLVISPINGRIYDFLPQAYANQIRNQEDFAGIHLFDLWTCNRDTRQAVYWKRSQQRKFTVTFVDNGHCFGGPDWKLSADLSANLVPLPCECSCWMAKLDAVAPGLLVRLAAGIPTEWYFNDGRGMCDMIRRLIARRAELRRLLSTSKEPDQEAETILLVEDDDLEGERVHLVVVAADGILLLQRETLVGLNQ